MQRTAERTARGAGHNTAAARLYSGEQLLGALAELQIRRARNFPTFLEELTAFQVVDMLILTAYDSELIQQGVNMLRMRGNSVTLNVIGGGRMKKLFKSALLYLFRALLFSPVPLLLGSAAAGRESVERGPVLWSGPAVGAGRVAGAGARAHCGADSGRAGVCAGGRYGR